MTTDIPTGEQIREAVRTRYAAAATARTGTDCCSRKAVEFHPDPVISGNYEQAEAAGLEQALQASLGCGNPTALIDLHPGQDVLDLGSGGGLDVLLSARRIAPGGTAHGVDMTDEMLDLARENQRRAGIENAVFHKGTLEDLPLPDASVDVVLSNCVINLAADKDVVLAQAHRVLRPGGRFAVSDIVFTRPVPAGTASTLGLWTGCVAGALTIEDYTHRLERAGFSDIDVRITRSYTRSDIADLAAVVETADLPENTDVESLITTLDGVLASAFISAHR